MDMMNEIRKELKKHLGKRVILKADKGRKKIVTKRGVLEAIYPSLFVVNVLNSQKEEIKVSYTYADILTSTVKITIVEDAVSQLQIA